MELHDTSTIIGWIEEHAPIIGSIVAGIAASSAAVISYMRARKLRLHKIERAIGMDVLAGRMRGNMRYLFILIFAASGSLSAEPMVLNWDTATKRTDGTPYLPADRGGTVIQYWVIGQPKLKKKITNPNTTSTTIDVPPGTYSVQGKHYDKTGQRGPYSPTLTKVVAPKRLAPPNPPSSVK